MSGPKQNKIILTEGIVKRRYFHIILRYGDDRDVIAVVQSRSRYTFVYQFLIDDNPEIVSRVMEELKYYLIELNEEDPWAYACYHCTTGANYYSSVHWSYCEGKVGL